MAIMKGDIPGASIGNMSALSPRWSMADSRAAATAGGYLGARWVRRMKPTYVRYSVIIIGLAMAAVFFARQIRSWPPAVCGIGKGLRPRALRGASHSSSAPTFGVSLPTRFAISVGRLITNEHHTGDENNER